MSFIQASSPGKVLILGGYVIVEPNNVGISVGVNARFTTKVKSFTKRKGTSQSEETPLVLLVHILSPQFHQSYAFEVKMSEEEILHVQQVEGIPSVFLKYAVFFSVSGSLRSSSECIYEEIHLELLADNDFYSQKNYLDQHHLTVTVENLRQLSPHLPLVGDVSKTGLGSSAAMTTSVVACLHALLLGTSNVSRDTVHSIAQIAHSVAQKKIGSGFDVFTAVFGTSAYRRFSPEGVSEIVDDQESPSTVRISVLQRCMRTVEASVQHSPFHLPPGITLLLGDSHKGGSTTPGMVVKIMSWKKSVENTANNLWEQLKRSNEAYINHLQILLQVAHAPTTTEEYKEAFNVLQSAVLPRHHAATPLQQQFLDAHHLALQSRRLLRQVGEEANVEVEPSTLTSLLDETAALPGVFATGCPGAGGYDAIFALVFGSDVAHTVEVFWESRNVCPLLVREDPQGLVVEEIMNI